MSEEVSEEVSEVDSLAGDVREFMEEMVEHLDWELGVDIVESDPEVLRVDLSGEDRELMLRNRAEILDVFQYLANRIFGRDLVKGTEPEILDVFQYLGRNIPIVFSGVISTIAGSWWTANNRLFHIFRFLPRHRLHLILRTPFKPIPGPTGKVVRDFGSSSRAFRIRTQLPAHPSGGVSFASLCQDFLEAASPTQFEPGPVERTIAPSIHEKAAR